MKSDLMRRTDLADNDEFKRDLARFFGISSEKREVLIGSVIAIIKAYSDVDREKILAGAAESLGASVAVARSALAIGRFLVAGFIPEGDTPVDDVSDLCDDFLEIGAFPAEKKAEATMLVASVRDAAVQKLDLLLKERSHSQSTIPNLESIDGSVDLRVVFDKYFDSTMNLSDFHPKLLSAVPVLVVRLALSGEKDNEVVFQANPRTLQLLIEHLRSYQRQLNMACEHYSVAGADNEANSSS